MDKRRLLYSGLIVATLALGVVLGTVVSDRVTAQQPVALQIPEPQQLSNIFARIAEEVGPAVVSINTEAPVQTTELPNPFGNNNPFGDLFPFFNDPQVPGEGRRSRGLGSGFIVDEAGYIVTNNHVIDGADKITVRLDDEAEYEATVVGVDAETDIAVIKIDTGANLPVAKMGNSEAVRPGDWVLALGSPFGFDHTLTAGIVSAKGRNVPGSEQFQRFIQTDAAINPGNSGGPLVNMAGEVIGVNTAIISNTQQFAGLGFAMPSNVAIDVYNQITTSGRVTRGSIGISYGGQDAATLRATIRAFGLDHGVIVQAVTPGFPAEQAGIQVGDVITSIAEREVTDGEVLVNTVASLAVGQTVPIEIFRPGEGPLMLDITIADRADLMADRRGAPSPRPNGGGNESVGTQLGIRVQEIPPQARNQPDGRNLQGVMVATVETGSAAAEAGLQRGMIITRMITSNGRQAFDVRSVRDFTQAERQLESGNTVTFQVLVQGPQGFATQFLPMRVP